MDYFRPDCESPARFDTFGKSRTICNHTITSVDVKRHAKVFLGPFHTPVEAVKNRANAQIFAGSGGALRGEHLRTRTGQRLCDCCRRRDCGSVRGRLSFLLSFFGPGWGYAVHARIGDGLTEMLVIVRDQDINHITVIGVRP